MRVNGVQQTGQSCLPRFMIRLTVRSAPSRRRALRLWLTTLNTTRADEARATLVDEGCTHEIGLFVEPTDGPPLVYAMEAEDEERSRQAARVSQHPIDGDHRRVMQAALGDEPEMDRLLDLRRDRGRGSESRRPARPSHCTPITRSIP